MPVRSLLAFFFLFAASASCDIAETARQYQNAIAADEGFSGVVLIGLGEEIVYQHASGRAEADLGVPMHNDHRFRIGSLTKPVTASAVMVAVDRGLIGLSTHACSRLPACPDSWAEVTVRHLLTHTSGIPDHFGDLGAVPVAETAAELQRVMESLPRDEPLASAPGSEYQYSNFNYVLLGAILEGVTGRPWEAVLKEWVFEPLQLSSMAYDDVYAIMKGRVRGYDLNEDGELRNIDYDDHAAYAAGGLLSTADDLFRWSRGVLGGALFSAQLLEESLTPFKGNYGYGWQIRRFFEREVYNHSGGIDGFASHLAHYPAEDLTIVVLSNVEAEPAILRACDVAGRIFAWPGIMDAEPDTLTPQLRYGVEQ